METNLREHIVWLRSSSDPHLVRAGECWAAALGGIATGAPDEDIASLMLDACDAWAAALEEKMSATPGRDQRKLLRLFTSFRGALRKDPVAAQILSDQAARLHSAREAKR